MDLVGLLTRHRDVQQLVMQRVTLRDKRSLMRVCKTLYWIVKRFVEVNAMPSLMRHVYFEYKDCFCGKNSSSHVWEPFESFERDAKYFECAYGHRSIAHVYSHFEPDYNVNCGKCGMHAVEVDEPAQRGKGREKRLRVVTHYKDCDGYQEVHWQDEKKMMKHGFGSEADDYWLRVE
jgi:hypothetical protein